MRNLTVIDKLSARRRGLRAAIVVPLITLICSGCNDPQLDPLSFELTVDSMSNDIAHVRALTEIVTDDELTRLGAISSLESIVLSGTDITDNDIRFLSGLTHLKSLYLERTKISGVGIRHLRKSGLQSLSLDGCPLTAEGLSEIRGLPHLTSASIMEAPVRRRQVEELIKALPNTAIYWVPTQAQSHRKAIETINKYGGTANWIHYRSEVGIDGFIASKPDKCGLLIILDKNWTGKAAHLDVLQQLNGLHTVSITGVWCDDEAVQRLEEIPRLQKVILRRTSATDTAISELRSALPGAVVEVN